MDKSIKAERIVKYKQILLKKEKNKTRKKTS